MKKLFVILAVASMMLVGFGCKRNGGSVDAPNSEVVTPVDTLAPSDSLVVDGVVDTKCEGDCECDSETPCDNCESETAE